MMIDIEIVAEDSDVFSHRTMFKVISYSKIYLRKIQPKFLENAIDFSGGTEKLITYRILSHKCFQNHGEANKPI